MCTPKMPDQKTIPERQAMKLPDSGSTADTVDEDIRRRRALMATAYTGQAAAGTAPAVTSVLGG